jgi:peptidyl-tRNA hydrolase
MGFQNRRIKMANIRLTVVVRKDLQMPEGLLAAQVAHMSDAFMRKGVLRTLFEEIRPEDVFSRPQSEWCKEPYLSVLAVNSYEDLVEIKEHAEREKLPVHCWKDLVPSPTIPDKSIRAFVGLAIGPADFDAIKIVTGALELY